MSHNIYNQKFISLRQPAWHNLGLVIEDEINAVQAGQKLGLPIITTRPIRTDDGIEIPGWKCILGKEGDNAPVPFSVVSNDYHEITHGEFLEAWDRATNAATIETIGLLGKGENLFVTTKLQPFDVKGDECDSYLLAANILTGKEADFARVTPVRVVCQNTLNLSASRCGDEFRVVHTGESIKQIETWLTRIWRSASEKQAALKEAYTVLANSTPSVDSVIDVLESTYPLALKPNADERTNDGLDLLAAWQRGNARQIEHQQSVNHLFEGTAVGSDLAAARGTAWGLWNAVVEYEDYSKPRRQATSSLFGAGADRKQAAFDSLIKLAVA